LNTLSSLVLDHHSKSLDFLLFANMLILIPFEKFVEHNKYIRWNRRDFRTGRGSGRRHGGTGRGAASNGAWGTIKIVWSPLGTNTPTVPAAPVAAAAVLADAEATTAKRKNLKL